MNKKTVTIVSGVAGTILALSACGTDEYEYDVSGVVQAQQVDYDCPGEDIAMDAVAFTTGRGGGGKSTKSSKSSDSSSSSDSDSDSSSSGNQNRSNTSTSKTPSKAPSKAASGQSGTTSSTTRPRSASPTASKAPKNKGVKLTKKPDKPQRLKSGKLPKVKYKFKPKGCETEYEIFVLADDGYLYEQDVRKADYDACENLKVADGKKKLFPLCTKG